MSECAICQGYPEEHVLHQYVQTDLAKPPTPITEEGQLYLYEEEEKAVKANKPWSGILRPLFRALGFLGEEERTPEEIAQAEPRSKKIARSKRAGGLFER